MSFEEWYQKETGENFDSDEKNLIKKGWNSCKEEVLKILNRPNRGNINDLPEDRIKEINNL